MSTPFDDTLRAVVNGAAQPAGVADLEVLEPWLQLAAATGPTLPGGDLTHDIVVPREGAFGLNLFAQQRPFLETARHWARRHADAATVEQLLSAASETTHWHGGVHVRGGQWRLKLYASVSRRDTSALAPLLQHLGVHAEARADARVYAVGMDITGDGVSRARTYRRIGEAESTLALPNPLADRWLRDVPASTGWSHRILAALGSLETSEWKRSLDHIFTSRATLDELREVADAVDTIAGSRAQLDGVAQLAALTPPPFVLRPVAYELDLFANRPAAGEALLTVSREDSAPTRGVG